ncbi:hypothetical protein FVR03_01375 [Pontibacter qinzhouensis]|uniref:Prophage tail endopeptidase domain-containing protein n=1 Tax=Pontibacter qinzhouensis TaxID=2603253 RepID=A0A5C8KFC0_9BACT|nr:phage tail protein [Pontibacter qinzhouensis]TXK52395.1 hypothetical protein FVR03_01375 [Pontibacter qinzhouensis]
MKLEIFRGDVVVSSIPLNANCTYSHILMGEHKITCNDVEVTDVLDIQLGDYISYEGNRFYINTVPAYTKYHAHKHVYSITFESLAYRLYDKKLMQNGEFITDFFGDARLYLQLIVNNINEIDSGWEIGEVAETSEKHIEFGDKPSCRGALTLVAEQFKLEYYLTGKVIHMVKSAGAVTSLVFSQGRGKGLYTFNMTSRNDANIVTRVYGFGGDKNIPADYRLNAAQIPASRIRIAPGYLEMNTDLYGVKEGIYQNDEIFPRRTGKLTGAGDVGNNLFFVTDSTLEFNINDHLLEGLDATVEFKTGDLAGYGFTISRYDHSTRTFALNVDKNQVDYPIPNTRGRQLPKTGDSYTLVNIRMPQEYVESAEAEILAETQQYIETNSRPLMVFTLNLDEKYVKEQGIRLQPGDRVTVQEPKLGIDTLIRTTAVSWPLLNRNKIQATIADYIPYTRQERLIVDTIENKRETIIVDRINAERARRTAAELRQLRGLIKDPDDYFDVTGIKPGTIETLYLAVGAKSQNFGLDGVTINVNANADPNSIYISSGRLIHYEIEIEGLGYIWQIEEKYVTGLDPAKAYYLAARVERTALRGTWSITEDFKATESEPGVWYFNLGIVYPVKDGYRNFDLTKGMTTIVGDTITTGTVRSIDKVNYFNLNNGTFNLGSGDTGIDYGVTKEGQLTIKKAVMAEKVMVGSGGQVNAYISGVSDNGPQSVRISAGANGEFRVLDNGQIFAVNADIAGKITARTGSIGNFDIEEGSLYNDDGEANIILKSNDGVEARIGSNANFDLPANVRDQYRQAARFTNNRDNPNQDNYSVVASASGGRYNIAIAAYGATLYGGPIVFNHEVIRNDSGMVFPTTSSYTATNQVAFIVYSLNSNGTINLPPNPMPGQQIEIRRTTNINLTINGNGKQILNDTNAVINSIPGANYYHRFVFSGTYWMRNR